jgi:hypothetical protein
MVACFSNFDFKISRGTVIETERIETMPRVLPRVLCCWVSRPATVAGQLTIKAIFFVCYVAHLRDEINKTTHSRATTSRMSWFQFFTLTIISVFTSTT